MKKRKRGNVRMNTGAKPTPEEELLQSIYKNARMGCQAITSLLPRVTDDNQRSQLTDKLAQFQYFATEASKHLFSRNLTPKELKFTDKIPAEAGIFMNTMLDQSPAKVAELMINGSSMGVIDMEKSLHACTDNTCSPEVQKLATDMISYEERTAAEMKGWL